MRSRDGRVTLADIFAVMRDPSLTAEEKVLWALYRSYERPDRGSYCNAETLAEHMGTTTRSIERYRASLLRDEDGGSRGYLEMTFRGPNPAEYRACVPFKAPTGSSEQEPRSPDKDVGASERSSDRSSDSAVGQVREVREETPPLPPPPDEDAEADRGGSGPRPSPPELPPPTLSRLARWNGRRVYPAAFERVWAAYPKRAGGNSKPDAYRAWRVQIVAGIPAEELAAGVRRYATYCKAEGMVGTRYVMQAATFFGRGEHWREEWALAPSKNGRGPPQAERYTSGRKVLEALEASP